MHSRAMYLYYKYSVLKIKYKCIIVTLGVDMCLVVTIKVFDSMLPKVTTQFSRKWKNFETLQKLFVKHDSRASSFLSIKSTKIWSFYKKQPIFGKRKLRRIFLRFFFEKLDFLRGGSSSTIQIKEYLKRLMLMSMYDLVMIVLVIEYRAPSQIIFNNFYVCMSQVPNRIHPLLKYQSFYCLLSQDKIIEFDWKTD